MDSLVKRGVKRVAPLRPQSMVAHPTRRKQCNESFGSVAGGATVCKPAGFLQHHADGVEC